MLQLWHRLRLVRINARELYYFVGARCSGLLKPISACGATSRLRACSEVTAYYQSLPVQLCCALAKDVHSAHCYDMQFRDCAPQALDFNIARTAQLALARQACQQYRLIHTGLIHKRWVLASKLTTAASIRQKQDTSWMACHTTVPCDHHQAIAPWTMWCLAVWLCSIFQAT